jgi:hypothetical protein
MSRKKPDTEIRAIAQIITAAKFRRPGNPRTCSVHKFHLWRWKAKRDDPSDAPPAGKKCQCGLLRWQAVTDLLQACKPKEETA